MRRSLLSPALVFLLALLVLLAGGAGCGGGGGSSSGGNDGGNGGTTGISSLALVGTDLTSDATRSLLNTSPGEQIVLRALLRDSSGAASFTPLTNVVFNVPSGVATYDPATGIITAVAASSGTYTIRATASGSNVTAQFRVTDGLAGVSGLARLESGTAVPGTVVKFFSPNGTTLATAPIGPTGRFQANIPVTATKFTMDVTSVSTMYYSQFGYGQLDYGGTSDGCAAPLPSLTAGVTTPLPNDIVLTAIVSNVPPPPPPTGCSL